MRIFAFAAATAIILAASATSAETSDASKVKPVATADKPVCRSAMKTGSIMLGRKECHTKSEWARIDGQNQDNAQRAGDRNRGSMMPGRSE